MHLIFDLDGTLVDSLHGIATTINRALETRGLPTHDLDAVTRFIGKGSLELARQAMPEGSPDSLGHELDAAFQRDYADHWQDGSTLYPEIDSMVAGLANAGHRLAVLSNKPDAFTREIVDHFFPDRPFDAVLGKSDRFPRKPAPDAAQHLLSTWAIEPQAARFIGDSIIDQQTAESADIPFVAVAWGYHDPAQLGPTIAADASALKKLLMAL